GVDEESAHARRESDRALEPDDHEAPPGLQAVRHPVAHPGVHDDQPRREEEAPEEHDRTDADDRSGEEHHRQHGGRDHQRREHREEGEGAVDHEADGEVAEKASDTEQRQQHDDRRGVHVRDALQREADVGVGEEVAEHDEHVSDHPESDARTPHRVDEQTQARRPLSRHGRQRPSQGHGQHHHEHSRDREHGTPVDDLAQHDPERDAGDRGERDTRGGEHHPATEVLRPREPRGDRDRHRPVGTDRRSQQEPRQQHDHEVRSDRDHEVRHGRGERHPHQQRPTVQTGEHEPHGRGDEEPDERGDGDGLTGLAGSHPEAVRHLGEHSVGEELGGHQQEAHHHEGDESAVADAVDAGGRQGRDGGGRGHASRLATGAGARPTGRPPHPTDRPALDNPRETP
ncbi:unnamed protein product, partial [Penicillium discolor]